MPEEQNRVLTDHISTLLLCPTETAVNNLLKEDIKKGVYKNGDIMCDAVLYNAELAEKKQSLFFASENSSLLQIFFPRHRWVIFSLITSYNCKNLQNC
jgi:UDP-N-acetylglucosamine 2-epimerase